MRRLVAAIAAVILLSGVGNAAETPSADRIKADALTREGTSHFRLNEFDAALKAYKEAYRLSPKPELLYDIGQCYRKLDQKQAAVDSFKSYLQESTDEAQKATVRDLVDKLEEAIREEAKAKNAPPQGPLTPAAPQKPLLGTLRVTTVPDGATVRFDDDQRPRTGTTPTEFSELAPGARRIFITKDGYATVERNVDIVAGGAAVVDLQLTALAAVESPPPSAGATVERQPERPVYKKWWFWTTIGGAAVIALGVGLGVGLSSGPAAPSATTTAGTFRF